MQITVSAPDMSALSRRPVLPNSAHKVMCVDQDRSANRAFEKAEIPIFEPGLDELVAKNIAQAARCVSTTSWLPPIGERRCGVYRRRHARRGAATAMPI